MAINVTPLRSAEAAVARMPPQNEVAEQALLGAVLVNNLVFEKVAEFLLPEHFADPLHGRIFEACGKLIGRGQIANPVTLKSYFDQDGALAEIGGATYLVRLAASVVTVINAEDYGRAIREAFIRRQLIDIGEEVVNRAYDHDLDVEATTQIELAESRLFSLADTGSSDGGFQDFRTALATTLEMAEAAFRREGQYAGIATGLVDLDRLLGGLHPSDLVILAARPSMGKSALGINIAFHAATRALEDKTHERQAVAFFSLEMSTEQIATRILAAECEIPSEKIRRGDLSTAEFDKLVLTTQKLERAALYIDDTPAIPVSTLRTRARRLKRQQGLSLIVVDYVQLMRAPTGVKAENRVQEVSEITRGLKAIAKELDVPVLALAQLSRAVEQREDKRPQLSDLRESGSIEQDADVVMFIYREQYYLERAEPTRRPDESDEKYNSRVDDFKQRCEQAYGKAEVIVGKQRHGPTGRVTLQFDGPTQRFTNFASDDHLPEAY